MKAKVSEVSVGAALCPSKSGLLNKHIVKHIVKHFWEAETIPLEMAGAVVVV